MPAAVRLKAERGRVIGGLAIFKLPLALLQLAWPLGQRRGTGVQLRRGALQLPAGVVQRRRAVLKLVQTVQVVGPAVVILLLGALSLSTFSPYSASPSRSFR